MALITEAAAVAHLRLPDDYPAAQVSPYLLAAIGHAQTYLGRRLFESQEALDAALEDGAVTEAEQPMVINDEQRGAILLMLGYLFRTREAEPTVLAAPVYPTSVYALLGPYRLEWAVN